MDLLFECNELEWVHFEDQNIFWLSPTNKKRIKNSKVVFLFVLFVVVFFAFGAGWARWELWTGGATESVSAGGPPTSAQSCGATLSCRDGLQPRWERTRGCGGPTAAKIKSTSAVVYKQLAWRMNLCPETQKLNFFIDAKRHDKLCHYNWMTHSTKRVLKWASCLFLFFLRISTICTSFNGSRPKWFVSPRVTRDMTLGETCSPSLSPPRLGLLNWFVCSDL